MGDVISLPAPATPPGTLAIPARTSTGINWTGAFLLYAKGASLQEIAGQLKIDFGKLKLRARNEGWEEMVRLNGMLALRAPEASVALVIAGTEVEIKANRAAALKVAQGLRSQIQKVLDAYQEGQMFLPPQDIAKLATAARAIDESAMMALGDDPAPKLPPPAEDPSGKKPTGREAPHTHFHLYPPVAAMAPRRVQGEAGAAIPVRGVAVDAVMTPARVELVPEDTPEPSVPTGRGRHTVDFAALAKQKPPGKPAATGKGIPDFARG